MICLLIPKSPIFITSPCPASPPDVLTMHDPRNGESSRFSLFQGLHRLFCFRSADEVSNDSQPTDYIIPSHIQSTPRNKQIQHGFLLITAFLPPPQLYKSGAVWPILPTKMLPGLRSLCSMGGLRVWRCSMPLAMLRTMDTSLAESHLAAALWCSMTSRVPLGQYSMMRYRSSPC